MYVIYEFIGGVFFWGLHGFKGDYKNYQTGTTDSYGKRVRNRCIGILILLLIFNIPIYFLTK